jgi:uncharacterized membrane protein YtjA (UPF0391 family)
MVKLTRKAVKLSWQVVLLRRKTALLRREAVKSSRQTVDPPGTKGNRPAFDPRGRHQGSDALGRKESNKNMLSWAITFLIIAIIAAILGFGGVAGTAVGIAKLLFFVFLILFVVSLLMGRRTPPVA